MRVFICVVASIALGAPLAVAHAEDVPGRCLQSFNVKKTAFSAGNSTVSCVLLEKHRVALTLELGKTPDTGEIDGAAIAKRLDAFEASIKKNEDSKNWPALAEAVTGNTLATLGLGACLPTLGSGCLMAGVGKIMAIHGLMEAATSEADKARRAREMREFIDGVRRDVVGKKSQAKATRDRMVSEAKEMCAVVEAKCL